MKYQKIKIGGIDIEGKDRYPEYKAIFKKSIKNKSLLDIGCNLGFYCFQACFDGATYAMGIDNSPVFIEEANKIKDILGIYGVYFACKDVFDFVDDKQYDYVICLNFLHNMNTIENVNKVLRLCDEYSKDRMIFSVISPSNKNDVYSIEVNKNGHTKVHVSVDYIKSMFPSYKVKSSKSKVTEGRMIVDVNK